MDNGFALHPNRHRIGWILIVIVLLVAAACDAEPKPAATTWTLPLPADSPLCTKSAFGVCISSSAFDLQAWRDREGTRESQERIEDVLDLVQLTDDFLGEADIDPIGSAHSAMKRLMDSSFEPDSRQLQDLETISGAISIRKPPAYANDSVWRGLLEALQGFAGHFGFLVP